MKLYDFIEGLYDTVAYSNVLLYLVIQETLSVPVFVMIMQKFFLRVNKHDVVPGSWGNFVYFSDALQIYAMTSILRFDFL